MSRYRDETVPDARIFEARARVQWADIDIAGIMYFAAYQRTIERAEMDFFRELGFPYNEVFDRYDIWLPRVHVEADYHRPALMDDHLLLRTQILRVGGSSVAWRTVVHNERTDEAGAVFHITVACMDRRTRKSCPLPPDLREALLRCVPPS